MESFWDPLQSLEFSVAARLPSFGFIPRRPRRPNRPSRPLRPRRCRRSCRPRRSRRPRRPRRPRRHSRPCRHRRPCRSCGSQGMYYYMLIGAHSAALPSVFLLLHPFYVYTCCK